MSDIVEQAKAALGKLGPSMTVFEIERYAEWLQADGPRQLLAEIDRQGPLIAEFRRRDEIAERVIKRQKSELESLRAAVQRVRDLVDGWMRDAGPDSKAHVVYGPQTVSVAFAHKEILGALELPGAVGTQQTTYTEGGEA